MTQSVWTTSLYGCVAGIELPCDKFKVANGITLSKIFADIFNTPVIAFAPPETGKHHPGPWSAVRGGSLLQCRAQIEITDTDPYADFSDNSLAWFVVALMRLKLDAPIRLAATSRAPFAIQNASQASFDSELFEAAPVQWGIFFSDKPFYAASAQDLNWLELLLPQALALWKEERFRLAFTIFDQARWSATSESSATMLWTAIEILLGISAVRDKTRAISAGLSDFIAKDQSERDKIYPVVRDLYRTRGSVIHAGGSPQKNEFVQLFRFVAVALQKALVGRLPPV